MGKRIIIETVHLRLKYVLSLVVLILTLVSGSAYLNSRLADQTLESVSWVMTGKVIAVDPGHGGYDPGAKGPGGTLEKDVNLAIGKKLAEVLNNAGAVVVMTRESDTDLVTQGSGTKKLRDLNNRLQIASEAQAQIYIGIQANGSGSRWRGAQTFFHPKYESNRKLAKWIQAEIRNHLQNTTRKALQLTEPYLLQQLEIPAVFVEVGFLTNSEEEKLLNDPEYQGKMARAIYSGVLHYLSGEDPPE